ncbi:hypothetical protein F8M41_017028 [Gigaspora margarita]|uniref:Uncharacterized protein n=1 Tax=Gigaspora margarita TaxID=4874 RepID=A0A8H4ANT5_GIGMA|nr:hypothetical protein F8M41_017028 [Gigaspora margarita]
MDLHVDMAGTGTPAMGPKDQNHIIPIPNVTKKHLLSNPIAIEVLDAFYGLDKPMEEPLDDTGFGSNKKKKEPTQELIDEISTKRAKKRTIKKQDEDGTIERLIRINEESTNGLVEFSSSRRRGFIYKDLNEETDDVDETYIVNCCYQNSIDFEKDEFETFIPCQISAKLDLVADTNHTDKIEDPENCHLEVEKKVSQNYQKYAKMDIVRSLKKLDLEEKCKDDESDNVDDNDEMIVGTSKWNKELKRQPERKLTKINDMPNADDCYRYKIWESTDVSDNEEEIEYQRGQFASQFDPGEFCWQKLQLKKIRKEKLVGSNDNNNNGIKNSIKKRGSLVPSEDDKALDKINWEVLVRNNNENDEEKNHKKEKPLEESLHQMWNRRLQISYMKMDDLPKSNREVNQYIKHAENGEIVTSKVGDVSECIDIIEAIDSEIVHHLFDPGGSICPNILCRPKES